MFEIDQIVSQLEETYEIEDILDALSEYLAFPMNSSTNENEFVRHEPCPECTSSDAFAIYSDGGGYCFSCGYHSKGNGQPVSTTTTTNP